MRPNEWFLLNDPVVIDSPALLVFPDRIRKNIGEAIKMAGGAERMIPHVKTHKMAEVARLQMEAGVQRFKCATIAEAEMLAIAGAPFILIAYQLNKTKAIRLLNLMSRYPDSQFASLVDNAGNAGMLNDLFEQNSLTGKVYIDVDNGMHRTGLSVDEDVAGLYVFINSLPAIRCVGLHVYDGHLRIKDVEQRSHVIQQAFKPIQDIVIQMEEKGYPSPEVIAGGSPSFSVHAANKRVFCSPGTNVFWDHTYASLLPEQHFEFAAVLLTRIISKPQRGYITTDLGHKSVAAENPIGNRVYFLNLDQYEVVSQSEEHLVIKVEEKDWEKLKTGNELYGIPHHICPTVALYNEVQVTENGEVTGQWKVVARNRKIEI